MADYNGKSNEENSKTEKNLEPKTFEIFVKK